MVVKPLKGDVRTRPTSRNDRRLPNVLYLLGLDPAGKFGSMEEQMLILSQRFRDAGSAFVPVYLHRGGPRPKIAHTEAGLPCEFLDLRRFTFKEFRRLLSCVRNHDIDIVHWNFYNPLINGFLWGLSVAKPRLVHFLTDHNSRPIPYEPKSRPLASVAKKILLKRYAKVLCISDFVLDCLKQTGEWSNMCRCKYFINTGRFIPNEQVRAQVRCEMEIGDAFVILVVAHLISDKGVDVAIRALRHLPGDVVLWVVGDGAVMGDLRALAGELSLESRVRFLGNQAHVEPFMQAADCLACPSVWGEAVGLVNLEGLATGLPVVASAVGGIPEFIEDRRNGLLFPAGDAAAMAERIQSLRVDPDAYRIMASNARKMALERFSIESRVDEYLEFYATSFAQ